MRVVTSDHHNSRPALLALRTRRHRRSWLRHFQPPRRGPIGLDHFFLGLMPTITVVVSINASAEERKDALVFNWISANRETGPLRRAPADRSCPLNGRSFQIEKVARVILMEPGSREITGLRFESSSKTRRPRSRLSPEWRFWRASPLTRALRQSNES